jgi:hypothetical protein
MIYSKHKFTKSNTDLLGYLALSLLILLPLLGTGYIQTFDMPWGPIIPYPVATNNAWLFYHLQHAVSLIIGSMLLQKLMLIGLFAFMGLGAHKLISTSTSIAKRRNAFYVSGIFYIFNPFVYTRFMAGQWLVLFGYALLPWTVRSLWKLMQEPSYRTMLLATVWSASIGLTSIHVVGFIALASLVLFVAAGKKDIKQRFIWCGLGLFIWIAVNCLWLVPLIFGSSHTANQISSFGSSQLSAFATHGTIAGSVPLTTLLLEGFWADPEGRYYLPSHLGIYWWIVVVVLAGLIILGATRVIKNRDKLGISLLILAVIAWWLGMGVGWSVSAGTTHWLVNHVPLYRGYREPEKWLMLLALAYSYLLAIGSNSALKIFKKIEWRQITLGIIALLPILYTPVLLWGVGGQLVSADYPSDWAKAETTLDQDKSSYKVLILPWHEYLPISFAKRVVANPANHYFKQNMVISDNPELRGVPPSESTPLYKLLDNEIIPSRGLQTNDASLLKPYNVKYVLLLKEADWKSYGWVSKQTGWQIIQNTAHIQLYKLKADS